MKNNLSIGLFDLIIKDEVSDAAKKCLINLMNNKGKVSKDVWLGYFNGDYEEALINFHPADVKTWASEALESVDEWVWQQIGDGWYEEDIDKDFNLSLPQANKLCDELVAHKPLEDILETSL